MSPKIRAEKEQPLEPPSSSMIASLHDDIIIDILARVPRCDYPTLFRVSKHFRSLVASPEIYARRSLLGCSEACLYVFLHNLDTNEYRFYILRRQANINNRLVLIPSLPAMPYTRCLASVGSRIYMFGKDMSSFAIECRSHTVHPLPRMPVPMEGIVADVIDEKIYVIGHTTSDEFKNVVVVFNTKTQMWEHEVTKSDTDLSRQSWGLSSVVMGGKMYMRCLKNSFVYMPKESKWETDEMLNSKDWNYACAIDDVMYYYDTEKKLRAYDTKNKCWSVVKGVTEFVSEVTKIFVSNAVSYGGKVGVFLPIAEESKEGIDYLFVEITIERCKGGEIWGKVECCDLVCDGIGILLKPLVVMV